MAKPGFSSRCHQRLHQTWYHASYRISRPSMCNMCTYRGMAERGHPGPAASSRVSNDISGILGCFYWAPGLHDALGGLLA
ncbi:hypothetical protein N5P37_002009 [Trichoderma harzianum]|uniref:Uncharacterized protein n=1 Tax=Trichoderma harzianum CBS 226.95 TaxID=983964 RepID=A0A2T4APA9_TRIHA|nr:hypothetical protein M431DRAFT_490530 [Trichoderma harzianum CBS 226.95]KAK0766067.1 hypothetical protein N5P37_002009 [Trichoderma harzianum]PTB58901.1 hypothetical protein M431DRAFT_490530 [Trichoderma harzianum CBS 226.95]